MQGPVLSSHLPWPDYNLWHYVYLPPTSFSLPNLLLSSFCSYISHLSFSYLAPPPHEWESLSGTWSRNTLFHIARFLFLTLSIDEVFWPPSLGPTLPQIQGPVLIVGKKYLNNTSNVLRLSITTCADLLAKGTLARKSEQVFDSSFCHCSPSSGHQVSPGSLWALVFSFEAQ